MVYNRRIYFLRIYVPLLDISNFDAFFHHRIFSKLVQRVSWCCGLRRKAAPHILSSIILWGYLLRHALLLVVGSLSTVISFCHGRGMGSVILTFKLTISLRVLIWIRLLFHLKILIIILSAVLLLGVLFNELSTTAPFFYVLWHWF